MGTKHVYQEKLINTNLNYQENSIRSPIVPYCVNTCGVSSTDTSKKEFPGKVEIDEFIDRNQ